MGMSASQARYISLTARMNDTEYEAQQVNQQRLTLTNKMNEVYESLVNMEVPTPPSKIDFLIENFAGKIEGVEVSVRQNNSGKYVAYETVEGQITKKTSGEKVFIRKEESDNPENVSTNNAEGTQQDENEKPSETGIKTNKVRNYLNKEGTVSDIPLERNADVESAFQALKHSNLDYTDASLLEKYQLVTYDDNSYAFVLRSEFEDEDTALAIYEIKSGMYEQEYNEGNYTIEYTTAGRVKSIASKSGERAILETEQKIDEIGYAEAEAQYEYDKAVYDREQNTLNKQTALFQRQDKQLELKLTRLDSERNALNTELEAVKKVIQDSIEKGFKTFSG